MGQSDDNGRIINLLSRMKEMTTEIGIVTTLIGTAVATAADGTQRHLQVGDPIFPNEVITTGAASAVEIEFTNGSIMDLGRNSQALLDNDVFDRQIFSQNQETEQDDISMLQLGLLEGNDPTHIAEATASSLELDNEGNGSGIELIRIELDEQLFPPLLEQSTVDIDAQALSNAPDVLVQAELFPNLSPTQLHTTTNDAFAAKSDSTLEAGDGADNFIWTKATLDSSDVDTILDFNIEEDTLDFSDLLSDNSHEIEGIAERGYLQIQINTSDSGSLVQSIDLPNIAVAGNAEGIMDELILMGVINEG